MPAPDPLASLPTPDDGARRSRERVWDESTRPTAPPGPADRPYAAHELAQGRHLVDVHDHLRGELAQLHEVVGQVVAGTVGVGEARSHLARTTLRQNTWTLGAYCQTYCRVVTAHHTLEDVSMLPHLRAAEPGLGPVVDRLEAEHLVIAEVLERVDRALVAAVAEPGPEGVAAVGLAVDLLSDVLLSHLSYEEHQLVGPLARAGFS
ncbi:hemerythrin domain-containing protein [Pseudokineococcus lusitanus]|uniref:Hemerythrin HHE cation binding domain-containing protein n=1 Tax=Pseudokineococcus lusitanus TaxID=763993 RepID=A0A3N1HRS0_9ACTN|nr:hemerythrin domain-containing protein [Pseudokineococcus lusitanus]ROP45042.1 hemerythrin HHE cation binding domain-containing protein [Pseudokineococcus lusitanus]